MIFEKQVREGVSSKGPVTNSQSSLSFGEWMELGVCVLE